MAACASSRSSPSCSSARWSAVGGPALIAALGAGAEAEPGAEAGRRGRAGGEVLGAQGPRTRAEGEAGVERGFPRRRPLRPRPAHPPSEVAVASDSGLSEATPPGGERAAVGPRPAGGGLPHVSSPPAPLGLTSLSFGDWTPGQASPSKAGLSVFARKARRIESRMVTSGCFHPGPAFQNVPAGPEVPTLPGALVLEA